MAIALERSFQINGGGGGGGRTSPITTTSGGSSSGGSSGTSGFRPGQTVYIWAGKEEDITTKEAASAIERISQGGGLGAAIGTAIPGIGNAVGFVVGGVAGAVSSLFGGRDEKSVAGFVEKVLVEVVPGARLSSDETYVILPESYDPNAVMAMVKGIAKEIQKELSGDNRSDVGKWIAGLRLSSTNQRAKNVVRFKVAPPPANESVSENGGSENGGVQPITAGIGLAAAVLILGVAFGGG